MIVAIDLNPIDDVIDGIGGLIGGAASAAGEAVLDLAVAFVFGLIADAVASVTGAIVAAMQATTDVDLRGGFFPALTPIRQVVLAMAATLVLALLLLSVIRALAAGEPGAIVRAALVDVPAAMFMSVLSVSVAWALIKVVDEASLAVTGDVAVAMGRFTASLATVDLLTGAGLLGIIFGLLFIVGAILVWLQLLVRSALIYILVVMAPLGFATRAHPGTRHVARRTVEMGVALIVSKFGVAVAFGVGAAAVESGNPAEGGDLSSMMTGVAVMLMAAFMPWVIWKAIPVVEGAAVAGGVERAPVRGVVSAGSMAVAVGAASTRISSSGGATTGAAAGSGGGSRAAGTVSSAGSPAGQRSRSGDAR